MSRTFDGQIGKRLTRSDLAEIEAGTFVAGTELHEQLVSTNDRALELAQSPQLQTHRLPLLIVTNEQTGGRGRGANRWWAAEGSLAFSLLLAAEPSRLPQSRWPQVSLHVGLSVCQAIEDVIAASRPRLKWPNDVYLDRRKVSGILIEIPSVTPRMLVVGIGINVNNAIGEAPAELNGTTIALCEVAAGRLSLADVLTRVLTRLEKNLAAMGSGDDELQRRWRERCLLTDRHIRLELGTRTIEGTCAGIDDEGALVVKTEDGVERCFGGVVTHF